MHAPSLRRVFLGFPRPPQADQGLKTAGHLLARAGWGGRPTAPAALHVTLLFLGELDSAAVDAIAQSAAEAAAGSQSVTLVLDRWVFLPHRNAPRVLGAACGRVPSALTSLYRTVRHKTEPFLPGQAAPTTYLPHVTLMRRRPADPAGHLPRERPHIVWPVDRLVLWESHLRPEGPRYEEIAVWRLGPKKAADSGRSDTSPSTAG
jgi:2'-5' RNA ligase